MTLTLSRSVATEARGLPWRVAWTRGNGCAEVAEVLGDAATRATGTNLTHTCIETRTDVLVARRLSSFNLVPLVVPHDVDLSRVRGVTAAVGDGPHSRLAAAVTARLAARLDVVGELVSVFRTELERARALSRLELLAATHPRLRRRTVEAPTVDALAETVPPSTLLVLGAPGGSILRRQWLGPGHRLTAAAPGGSLVVRSAPRRCFHGIVHDGCAAIGPHMRVAEARRLFDEPTIPVAEHGRLLGVVRQRRLAEAAAELEVAQLMEAPVSVSATDPLDAAEDLRDHLDGGSVPVIGPSGLLIGTIPAVRGATRPVLVAS